MLHIKDVDEVAYRRPFLEVVERFCVYVGTLAVRLGILKCDTLAVALLFHAGNVDTVGTVEMPHCWVSTCLHDAYRALVVFMVEQVGIGIGSEYFPKVEHGYAFPEDGSVSGNYLSLGL